MYFIIYETTNCVNGKKYRGAHICEDVNDGYIGSGKLLYKAIAKYGIDNFRRTVLEYCSSIEEMFEKESQYVNYEWVNNKNTYNLKIGGSGGWDYINKNLLRWTEEKKKLQSLKVKRDWELGLFTPSRGFLGKKHSKETKNKISENNAKKLSELDVKSRLRDVEKYNYPKRGSTARLSKEWGLSHTQVRRFIEKYYILGKPP